MNSNQQNISSSNGSSKSKRDVYWINNTRSLFHFQFKRLFTALDSTLFMLLGPFGLLFLVSFIVPIENLMYLVLGTGILATSFFQFGNTYREWKQSKTIKNNMLFTKNNVVSVFLSFLLFSLIFAIFSTLLYLFLAWLTFSVINIGNYREAFFYNDVTGKFGGYDWGFISYIVVLNLFVSISVAYFVESFTTRQSTYALIAITYIIISLFGLNFINTFAFSITEKNEGSWLRNFQMIFPNWYPNYFTLYYYHSVHLGEVSGIGEMLKWTSDPYFNSTLVVPWIYSALLFTIGVVINVARYDIVK